MDTHKILIIEDEVLIAEDLKDMLVSFGFTTIFLAHDKSDGIALLESTMPDLVLLDIRMKHELDGLDIGNLINEKYQIPFIYITAHSDINTIREIVKTNPTGYITKPFKKSDLFANINLALSQKATKTNTQLVFKDGANTVFINYEDIYYIESENNYLTIFCVSKKYMCRQTIETFLDELTSPMFFKPHRSYIVNLSNVVSYSKKDITLSNHKVIPLSRSSSEDFEKQLKLVKGIK